MKEYTIYHYYPLGDNFQKDQERLFSLLKDGWKIISTGGQEIIIVYVLERVKQPKK